MRVMIRYGFRLGMTAAVVWVIITAKNAILVHRVLCLRFLKFYI